MNCQVLSTLYVITNGEVLCECDVGENISLGHVEAKNDWAVEELVNNENYAHIRASLSQSRLPWEHFCSRCAFLRTREPYYDRIAEKHLVKVQVELSLHCTLNCPCCSRRKQIRERPKPHIMDLQLFETLLRSCKNAGYSIDFLEFCGQGEPLSHPDFKRFVSVARSLVPRTKMRVVTNGNYDYDDVIGDEYLDEIYVSCDGVDQRSYEQYRRNGSVEKALTFMADTKKRSGEKPLVVWKYILFEFNDSNIQIIEAQKRAMEIGVDSIAFIRTHTEYKSMRFEMEGMQAIQVVAPITVVDSTPVHDGIHVLGEPVGLHDSRQGPILHQAVCVFDEVKLMGSQYITIRGWAMRKDGERIQRLKILCDHKEIGAATIWLPRHDVAKHYHGDGAMHSGFFISMKLAEPVHSVATLTGRIAVSDELEEDFEVLYRFDQPHLSDDEISLVGRPFGSADQGIIKQVMDVTCSIDSVRIVGNDYISIQGWAADKKGNSLSEIHVYINQSDVGTATVGLSRDDLAHQYPSLSDTRPGFSFLGTVFDISPSILTITLALTTRKKKTHEFEVIYRFDCK